MELITTLTGQRGNTMTGLNGASSQRFDLAKRSELTKKQAWLENETSSAERDGDTSKASKFKERLKSIASEMYATALPQKAQNPIEKRGSDNDTIKISFKDATNEATRGIQAMDLSSHINDQPFEKSKHGNKELGLA